MILTNLIVPYSVYFLKVSSPPFYNDLIGSNLFFCVQNASNECSGTVVENAY